MKMIKGYRPHYPVLLELDKASGGKTLWRVAA